MATRFTTTYGPWALVAGASEGLGAAYARALAARGLDVVLLARRTAEVEALAAELSAKHGVRTRPVTLDLAAPDLEARLGALTAELEIGLCVYNAAYSLIGRFVDQPLAEKLRVVDVNCRGPLVVVDQLGRAMAERGRGGLILVSSLAGRQGSPYVATYAASKAFELVLAEALFVELGERGVHVLAVCAGATRTPGYTRSAPRTRPPLMEPEAVVAASLAALGRHPSMVPGFVNRLAAWTLGTLLPRRAAVGIMGNTTRKMYGL